MSTHVRTVAALLLIGGIAGCSHMTTGTVAMTTEAGPPSADALTITCEEYLDLDAAEQKAIVGEILAQPGSVLLPGNSEATKTLADAVCQFLPKSTVKEILVGGPVP
jgi:hypothetical protein